MGVEYVEAGKGGKQSAEFSDCKYRNQLYLVSLLTEFS